ncbi:glycosyltransferase family A protein [Streptomyces sp. AK02-01A]|uniref:glycosyltransferase family A protein n=1 Tax=Streptomyces sp. AK02-01A TaxID=3028648 RepID=UPI0029A6AE39|nr:glycosyltransferase family A protein [Streptomyces sp. AK02-01A]MDX3851259.1 glycosyltransferase family A protein [Streptomyces sp. AK02-01A]
MTVKVTVVVPTYNSGHHVDPLVESMLRQTLPRDEFEVLFVDDGSTDDTPARLKALVAVHDHFRLTRISHSGWPGRPRNTGIDQAHGEYVQFVDHDDFMGTEALRRMYDLGHANASDIVIGKVVSDFRLRGVPHALMNRTRASCTVRTAALHDSLTVHKMYRTGFLREQDIRFPEGHWVGEDLLFMVPAVFRATSVSIVGDYPCYFYLERADGGHATPRLLDPATYSGNLRRILDALAAETGPGPTRDTWLRRFWRADMVKYLSEPFFPAYEPEHRTALFRALRAVAAEHLTDGAYAGLVGLERARAALVRDDRPDALLELARRAAPLRAEARLDSLGWRRGRLRAGISARFRTGPDGAPLILTRHDGRHFLDPALTDGVTGEPVEVTAEPTSFRIAANLRHQDTSVTWLLPHETRLVLEEAPGLGGQDPARVLPVVRGTVIIDPLRAAGGGPPAEGGWEIQVRLTGAGLDRYARLAKATGHVRDLPAPEIIGGHLITPALGTGGLTLTVRATDRASGPRPPKVSVVLPTAGAVPEAVADTLASLAAQSLPSRDIEVITVTETAPGADPRDTGTAAATGEYVLYLEPGDRLGDRALERMYAYGIEHDADIVAGKPAGRSVPRELFARDRPRATLAQDPLADSLTADKLFHRAFLTEHGLRFRGGPGPLAEQAFTAEAILRAGRTAVLGSHLCYHHGERRSTSDVPPGVFYPALRALVETVDGLTGPGAGRDRLHRRWLRVEILDRLTGKRFLDLAEDDRRALFQAIRELVVSGVCDGAVAGLPAVRRLAVGLIADDRLDDLVALARWEASVVCRARLDALSWRDGRLRLAFTGEPRAGDGLLAVTTAAGGQVLVPAGLSPALRGRFAGEPLTGADAPDRASAVLVLRERGTGAEYRPATDTAVRRADGTLSVAGTAHLDPRTAVDGAPLGDGVWDLYVRLTALGWTRTARLGAPRGPGGPEDLAPVPHPALPDRRIIPYRTGPGHGLSLRVTASEQPTAGRPGPGALRRLARRLRRP